MKRTANAVWTVDIKTGNGRISTESGVLKDTLNARISIDATYET